MVMKLANSEYTGEERDKKKIGKAIQLSKRLTFVEYPDFKIDIKTTNKKKFNTYTADQIKCDKCRHYQHMGTLTCFTAKVRKMYICKNFGGDQYNLQVCRDCYNVRIIEAPNRYWGICDPCKGKRKKREQQLQATTWKEKKKADEIKEGLNDMYKKWKEHRVKQLAEEWENG